MKPSLIIPRLRAQVAAFANRVGGAAEFDAAIDSEDVAVPAAFVVPLAELAVEGPVHAMRSSPTASQVFDEAFGVIVVVDNTSDQSGAAGADQIEDLRDALIVALVGWQPAAVYRQVRYAGSAEIAFSRARLWRQFDFVSQRIIQG